MQQELDQVVQATLIASDPSQGSLHRPALDYLTTIQHNSENTWRLVLSLYVDVGPDGARKYPPQARFFALRVLDDFFDNRFEPLDNETFETIRQAFLSYISSEFIHGSAEADATFLRNKFSHTLTLFFLCAYVDQWTSFFTDIFALIRPTESPSRGIYNRHVSLLLFHIVLEISGEIADQMIKSSRPYNPARHVRDARVRDAVRARDAAAINDAVLTIVADSTERMSHLREAEAATEHLPELDDIIEVVDWGVRTFGSYVGWIDINLTVTPSTIPLLFSLLQDPSLPIRLATCVVLLRIVSKGLKEPGDKLQLIKVLSLSQVIDALEAKTLQQQVDRADAVDEGEESYREALGKLLNALGLELEKLAEECPSDEIRAEASGMLSQTLPVVIRFLADKYDDTSSTVFPLIQTILTGYKRVRKLSTDPIGDEKRSFLASLLQVIIDKLKWDPGDDPDELDDDDKAAFDGLRKELRTFMDSVLMIDQDLVTNAVHMLALNILSAYQGGTPIPWNEAELAVYLVYVFGEIGKTGGKGRAAFCQAPAVAKEKRKETDYSEYPLTTHGEMLLALVQSGISLYPNRSVALQFFETVARYSDFFKVRKECILPTLEAMIGPRGIHSQSSNVRSRVYYLFHRFVKDNRNDFPQEILINIIDGIRDLLEIQVELPEVEDATLQELLDEAVAAPGLFEPQLYLYETTGILVSLMFKTPEREAAVLLSIVKPLLNDLSLGLQAATKNVPDVMAVLKIHHLIMALGNIAKGFPDYPSPVPEGYILPPLDVFEDIARAILLCLEAMNVFKVVRDATRFAFARILAVAGPNVTHFIPSLMANLLAQFEPAELVDFMNFISLLIHKLQKDMFDVLDELIGPLSSHITTFLSQPITGTDDSVIHTDTKRAYLALLNSVMTSKLHGIFLSERNKGGFETLLRNMQDLAEDILDPQSQKAAFVFLRHCVTIWGRPLDSTSPTLNGTAESHLQGLPGFEHFIYEQLIPLIFKIPSLPQFNIKDGQALVVLHEMANLLQAIGKFRGTEAYNYLLSVFLPAQNWPNETALEFTTKLRDLEGKNFRKYFTDVVRAARTGS